MPDNGFGSKANSADFLIHAYQIRPEFKTARGGSGAVSVGGYVQFRDPKGKFPHAMVRPDRLFTGAGHRSRVDATGEQRRPLDG